MSTTEHKPAALRLADDRPWQQGDDLYDWAIDAEDMLRSLYAENYAMRAQLKALSEAGSASEDLQLMRLGYAAAMAENFALRARVQELGELARNNSSRRVMELEAQLEAIGAGGVEPLRKRADHFRDATKVISP